jgi:Asp-tRNA(Asn)/Glu-tRNA(Gln) amidotransferase A subunit family amidase
MRADEYAAMDALAIASAVQSGQVSALEVTEAAIAAIEALNPRLNALVLADFERARKTARRVARNLPLAGVPFLIKDADIYTAEWPTTFSSRFFADARPLADSEIVSRWRRAGTVFLGKTNTPEFADDFVTEPVLRGATLNPWDARRDRRRLERRRRRRRRQRHGAGGARLRCRRLDPRAGRLLRPVRPQAIARPESARPLSWRNGRRA